MATRQPERQHPEESGPLAGGNGVPEGWTLSLLPDIVEINPPKPAATVVAPDAPVTFVPMGAVDERTGAIARPEVRPFSTVRKGFTAFADGDVIMAKITPCMENGKAAVARHLVNGLGFGSTEFHVFRSHGAVLPEYVYHYLRQESFRQAAEDEMTGSVGQKRVPRAFLESTRLPVPPLAEQERIVHLLERLLAGLDTCRDRLERTPEILSRLRQAVLSAACSGQLTADWRERRPVPDEPIAAGEYPSYAGLPALPPSWRWVHFQALIQSIRMGTTAPPRAESTAFPVLRSSSVRPMEVALDDVRFLNEPESRNEDNFLEDDDLLFTRLSGSLAYVANCARVDRLGARRIQFPDRLFRARLKEPGLGSYVEVCFANPALRSHLTISAKSSAGHQRVSMGAITSFPIPLPSRSEGEEIVRRVRRLITSIRRIEGVLAAQRHRVLAMREAVLHRAFRGELVPTEAEIAAREGRTYESAEELLVRIREGQAPIGSERERRRRPRP